MHDSEKFMGLWAPAPDEGVDLLLRSSRGHAYLTVWLILLRTARKKNSWSISVSLVELSKRARVSQSTARLAVRELERIGHLKTQNDSTKRTVFELKEIVNYKGISKARSKRSEVDPEDWNLS